MVLVFWRAAVRTRNAVLVCAAVGLVALASPLGAGEERGDDVVVAKVNGAPITRQDLLRLRRYLLIGDRQRTLDMRQVLDYAINRLLWEAYLEKGNLWPTAADVQRAIQQIDAHLRQGGVAVSGLRVLSPLGLTGDELAAHVRFELAMRGLAARMQAQLRPEEIKAEFDARPEWYDGSRVRISGFCLGTRHLADQPDKLEKAKQQIEKTHEGLLKGWDFDRLARSFSDDPVDPFNRDLGWFFRSGKAADESAPSPTWRFEGPAWDQRILEALREPLMKDAGPVISGTGPRRRGRVERLEEPLIAAAWTLKAGEFTRPIQSALGWHILKVTEREGGHFTFFGARHIVRDALVRRRLEAILAELRAAAKIETCLQRE